MSGPEVEALPHSKTERDRSTSRAWDAEGSQFNENRELADEFDHGRVTSKFDW